MQDIDDIDRKDWIVDHDIRNTIFQDRLLDWLNLYGNSRGFVRDTDVAATILVLILCL